MRLGVNLRMERARCEAAAEDHYEARMTTMRKGCGQIRRDLFVVKICGCSYGWHFPNPSICHKKWFLRY